MLINTKLTPPLLRSGLLYRSHLIQRLKKHKGYPLILLTGPAGSGKTSLICQWIKKERLKVAWFSLDREDNDPDLFWRYLITTLARMNERLSSALEKILATRQKLEEKYIIPLLIEALIPHNCDIYLVLDDLHNITNTKIHTALARLIQYIPSCLRLVILSRYRFPLAVESSAIKKEQLIISAEDLKFTETETADLYREVYPHSFSPHQIHALNRHVEGWAAGLQLIGLSVKSKGHVTDLSYILNQAHEQVASYLIHDILHTQPDDVRNFVLTTALLDRFIPELCTEAFGISNAQIILARLDQMNLFLIPLEIDRKWYRYHHMFAEVVRRQVSIENPKLLSEVLCSAAKWFAKNNYLEDALRCAFQSNDFEFAADLMEDNFLQYIDQLDPMAGLRWILRLPDSVLKCRGLLRLQQCGFLLILLEQAEVKRILSNLKHKEAEVFKRYSGPKREYCREHWSLFNCITQILYAEATSDAGQLKKLKQELSPKNPLLSGGIEMLLTFVLISKGEFSAAKQSIANVSKLTGGHDYMRLKVFFAKTKALINRHKGRLYCAETILDQAIQYWNKQGKGGISTAYLLHAQLAFIFYLQNKLEKAREYIAIAFQQNDQEGLITEIRAGYDLQVLLHLAVGDTKSAALRFKEIKALVVKSENQQIEAGAMVIGAKMALEGNNQEFAEQWSRQRNLQLDEPFSLLFAVECMTLARIFHIRRQYADAILLLETIRSRCEKRDLLEIVLHIDILHAAILHAQDRYRAAKSLLQQTLLFSEVEGYVRPYVNDARHILPILKNIAEDSSPASLTSHFKTVLTACGVPFNRPVVFPKKISADYGGLTPREIEILRLMAKGAKNKDIARQAFISLNTVKTHVKKILSKLDVQNRTQASLKARQMNLLKKG